MAASRIKLVLEFISRAIIKPEIFFATFATIAGVLLVFITPPLQAPDEQSHFFQAYSISNLDFVWERFETEGRIGYGSKLPTSIFTAAQDFLVPVAGNPNMKVSEDLYRQHINQPLDPQTTTYDRNGTNYSPLVYAPQAIGISIGKLFNASPLIMIWLGRLANLIVWILLIYISIRMIPFGKWAVAILALNPVAVFLSASLSADVMNIALTVLFLSTLGSVILSKKDIIPRSKIILLGSTLVGLALTKPVNIVFGLLLLTIPWRRFGSKLKFAGFVGVSIALMGTTALLWNAATSEGTQVSVQFQRSDVNINPTEQLTGIINDPLHFAKILVQNYVLVQYGYYGSNVLSSLFGVFGWLDTSIPLWTILLYIAGLLLALLYQFGRTKSFNLFQKAMFLFIFLGLCVANILAMYLVYTPVGHSVIDGVQGRYFIPASVLLIALFTARRKILLFHEKHLALILGLVMLIVLSMTILRIAMRYYVS